MSFWALPTPSQKQMYSVPQGSWTQFGSFSPTGTPSGGRNVQSNLNGRPITADSRIRSTTGSSQTTSASSDGYFDSQPSSSPVSSETTTQEDFVASKDVTDPVPVMASGGLSGFGLGAAINGGGLNIRSSLQITRDDEHGVGDDSDDGSPERLENANFHRDPSSSVIPSAVPVPSIEGPRSVSKQRPALYSQTSRSMVNLSSMPSQDNRHAKPDQARREDKLSIAPQLTTIRSREEAPSRIDLPPRTGPMITGMLSPNSDWSKPPPTPAAGPGGFSWGNAKAAESKPIAKRRRSADDMLAPPPLYEPPLPGTYIPRPRDEEGKEKLPGYWCAVSTTSPSQIISNML